MSLAAWVPWMQSEFHEEVVLNLVAEENRSA